MTIHSGLPNRLLRPNLLERLLILATLALGSVHAWMGRYAMNPDGISYLDVGDSFFRHDWGNAVNAWWSPLYPWILGTVLGVIKPSPKWEFPFVHAVNFVIFVIALFAFRWLLQGLSLFHRERVADDKPGYMENLPDWALALLAYPIFWWVALQIETVYDVSPDLSVMICFSLAAGMLLRLQSHDKLWKFALFGLILGIGYWTKAVLFPLGFVILAVGYWWRRSDSRWLIGMASSGIVFLCVAAPLILLLSVQKGRFTFGDSGRVNYAWSVSPRTQTRNWQGREAESGKPVHPTRQLLMHPPLFEFDAPVIGTYPPWTDPSYWNEGLQGHFRLRAQIEVLATTIPSELRLLLRAQPGLIVGIVVLALLSGSSWWSNLGMMWPLIAMSATGMAMYLPLIENDRYLGGFLLVLFVLSLAATRLRFHDKRTAIYVAFAVFVVQALDTADYTVRVVTNHYAIPGVGPNSTWQDVVAAKHLWQIGIKPGDKVGVIANGTGAYWARLAKLRIVAEIMDMNDGSREFWNSSPDVRQNVYRVFAQAHAAVIVTLCPAYPPEIPDEWQHIEGTPYCMRSLRSP
jgi:hypothetical protein